MSEKEKQDRSVASQEELMKALKLNDVQQHRTPASEEDEIAIDTVSIYTNTKKHKLEVLNSREASIGEKEGTIKVKDGGYEEINSSDKSKGQEK